MSGRRVAATLAISILVAATTAGAGASAGGRADPGELIVGGGPANAGGWGFTVGLKLRKGIFVCGGSVIAPTKVLTAAHCVKRVKRRKLRVIAGSPWISGKRAGGRIPIAGVAIHPEYNGIKGFRDFAVITLARPTSAPPIALPTPAESALLGAPGRTVRTAGWGARSAWGFRQAARLKSAKERVTRSRRCQRAYGKGGYDAASMICTVGRLVRRLRGPHPVRTDACFGDSGGPLVASSPWGPRLIGVVSIGAFPCGRGAPAIYARVSGGLPFIEGALGDP